MAAPSKKNGISILEFKAWLSGVEDMQGNTWLPNKEQWKKIRSKIDLLQEQVVEPQQYNVPLQHNLQPSHFNQVQYPSNGGDVQPLSIIDQVPPTVPELNSNIQSTDTGAYVPQFI